MKLVTYDVGTGPVIGALTADETAVIQLGDFSPAGEWKYCFSPMAAFFSQGSGAFAAAQRKVTSASEGAAEATVVPLSDTRLLPPVMPGKLFAIAGNYVEHIEEGGSSVEQQDKETPRVFMKPPTTTVIGPGEAIRIPPLARSIDWEGELAVVIGTACTAVKAASALSHVAGYTIMNDVSERDLKIWPRSETRPRDAWFDWLNGKWHDTFAPLGPWIVTKDEIPDPQALSISTFVNGERKQHSSTSQMIFPVAKLIEYISAMVTLEPGDVISTGTVAGVGRTTGLSLQPGDHVRVEITGIGSLENPVVLTGKARLLPGHARQQAPALLRRYRRGVFRSRYHRWRIRCERGWSRFSQPGTTAAWLETSRRFASRVNPSRSGSAKNPGFWPGDSEHAS